MRNNLEAYCRQNPKKKDNFAVFDKIHVVEELVLYFEFLVEL